MGRPDQNGCARCGRPIGDMARNVAAVEAARARGATLDEAIAAQPDIVGKCTNRADCIPLDWRTLYFEERERADKAESALARATVRPGEGQPETLREGQ